jgi:peptidyl-prolyl cis-trans isomerase A (cyclophilin A)
MKKLTLLSACVGAVVLVSSCSSGTTANAGGGTASSCDATTKAPDTYKVRFDTSKGAFVVEVHRDWAPNGADRFYHLTSCGFYNEARFFRVVPGFVVQWGINKDPKVSEQWREKTIEDDPVKESNVRGSITFATSGANSRTTQLFINLANNARLDGMGFSSFGIVTEGMEVVDQLYSAYGETPNQGAIQTQGNEYLKAQFPQLDYIKSTKVE